MRIKRDTEFEGWCTYNGRDYHIHELNRGQRGYEVYFDVMSALLCYFLRVHSAVEQAHAQRDQELDNRDRRA